MPITHLFCDPPSKVALLTQLADIDARDFACCRNTHTSVTWCASLATATDAFSSRSVYNRASCFRLKTSHVYFLFLPSSFVTRRCIRWSISSRACSRCGRCLNPLSPSPGREPVCVHSPLPVAWWRCLLHGGGRTLPSASSASLPLSYRTRSRVLVPGCVNSQAAALSNSLGDFHHTRGEIRARFEICDLIYSTVPLRIQHRRARHQSVTLCRLPSNPYNTPKNLASSITPPKYLLWLGVRRRFAV